MYKSKKPNDEKIQFETASDNKLHENDENSSEHLDENRSDLMDEYSKGSNSSNLEIDGDDESENGLSFLKNNSFWPQHYNK